MNHSLQHCTSDHWRYRRNSTGPSAFIITSCTTCHDFHAELFPGYVHRSTNRIGNTRVKNGLAKTYLFSKERKQREDESEIAEDETFSVSTPFNLSIQFSPVDDDDVKVFVKEVLALASLRDMRIDVLYQRLSDPIRGS